MKLLAHRTFVLREIFRMTLLATTRRGNLYVKGTTEKNRRLFQESLRIMLEQLASEYTVEKKETQHVRNIVRVSSDLSAKHANLLTKGRLRIGQSQKAVNLYLKYLWCLGEVKMPPHCPIDAIVLRHIPGFKEERWTQLDNIERYCNIISAAKCAAKENGVPLAQWELELYNVAA